MANYTTVADLVDDVLFRAGEIKTAASDSGSDYYTAVLRYLNRAYQAIWTGGGELLPDISEQWWWLKKYGNGVLTLLPVFDNGTVTVTNNDANINFSGIPTRSSSNISLEDWHFKVDNHADVFRIDNHTIAGTPAFLDSVYTGESDTAASFRAFKIDYALASDVMELDSPMFAFQGGLKGNRIEILAEETLREKWPMEQINPGCPHNFSLIALNAALRTVRFSHYGGTSDTELIRIDYSYLARPSDLTDAATEPAMPREHRKLLADWALVFVLQDKEDSRVAETVELASRGLKAMALENQRRGPRQSGAFGRIHTRQSQRARIKGPLRTSSGLIIA